MTDVRSKAVNSKPAAASGGGKVKAFFKYIGKNKMFCIGMLIVIIAVLSAVLAPVIVPCDPQQMTPSIRLTKPFTDSEHILGCDAMGRDIFSRILYGLRTSLLISIGGVALALAIGVVLGIISGFSHPNFIDTLIMRITDIQMGFPFIVLAIIALTLFEPNPLSIIIVLSLSARPAYARVVRSSVMMQKDMDYIAAARMMGAGKLRIAVKYVGKNLMPAILPVLPLDIAAMIINESLLSYMQLGIKSPSISLGNIMADGRQYISTDWWITAIPGIVIMIMVLALNFVGDSLQTKLDPKLRK